MSPYNSPTMHHSHPHHQPIEQPHYPSYRNGPGPLVPHQDHHSHNHTQHLQPYDPRPQDVTYYDERQHHPPYSRRSSGRSTHSHHSHRSSRSTGSHRSRMSEKERREVERRPTFGDTLMLIIESFVGAITGKRK